MLSHPIIVFLLFCFQALNTFSPYGFSDRYFQLSTETRKRAAPKRYLRIYSTIPDSLRAPEVTSLININQANLQELQKLPRIGAKRAAAIIEYRETLPSKKFHSIEQLYEIPGISNKSFERLKTYITL